MLLGEECYSLPKHPAICLNIIGIFKTGFQLCAGLQKCGSSVQLTEPVKSSAAT